MTEEKTIIRAVVRSLNGEEALVEVEQGGCGRCHEEGGCGGQHLTHMFCSGPKTYRVDNQIGAGIGDRVTVAVAAGSVRRVANLAYGIPLAATITGAAMGSSFNGDSGAVLGAVIALSLSLYYVRLRSQSRSGDFAERPHIVSRS